jgi:hypothetical protein
VTDQALQGWSLGLAVVRIHLAEAAAIVERKMRNGDELNFNAQLTQNQASNFGLHLVSGLVSALQL